MTPQAKTTPAELPLITPQMWTRADEPTLKSYVDAITKTDFFNMSLFMFSHQHVRRQFMQHLTHLLGWWRFDEHAYLASYMSTLPPKITLNSVFFAKKQGIKYHKIIIHQPQNIEQSFQKIFSMGGNVTQNSMLFLLENSLGSVRFELVAKQKDTPNLIFTVQDILNPISHGETNPPLARLIEMLGLHSDIDENPAYAHTHLVLIANQNAILRLLEKALLHKCVTLPYYHRQQSLPKRLISKKATLRTWLADVEKERTYDDCLFVINLYCNLAQASIDHNESFSSLLFAQIDHLKQLIPALES